MMRSFYAGVAGLRNHQIRMDVIGNNIANVNTIGFKKNRVTFADMLYQTIGAASAPQGGLGGTNPRQIGLGVGIASIDTVHTPGNIETTGRTEDLAIEGEGFFVLMGGDGERYVTRAGAFTLDEEGYLVSPGGYRLMGWQAKDGVINTDSQVPGIIQIPKGVEISPRASTRLELGGNLDSRLIGNDAIPVGTEITELIQVRDGLGTIHDVPIIFKKEDENTWAWQVDPNFKQASIRILDGSKTPVTAGRIEFAPDGTVLMGEDFEIEFDFGARGLEDINSIEHSVILTDNSQDVGTVLTHEVDINDALGNPHKVTITYKKMNPTDWVVEAQCPGAEINIANGAGDPPNIIRFDGTGSITEGGSLSVQVDFTNSGVVDELKPNYNDLIQKDNIRVTSTEIYDSQGNVHEVTIVFQKAADNTWIWTASCPNGNLEILDASNNQQKYGTVQFRTDGSFDSASNYVISIDGIPGVDPIRLSPDFTRLTQYANISSANIEVQDGYPRGSLTSIDIDPHGVIYGLYSNGRHQTIAQVAVGSFANVEGLIKVGQTMFRESSNSGELVIDQALTGGRGVIKSGSVEMSNVDLSQEFTDMIITQRGFQANSRVITTSDEMLQELVNLKR